MPSELQYAFAIGSIVFTTAWVIFFFDMMQKQRERAMMEAKHLRDPSNESKKK